MKSLRDYLTESEYAQDRPVQGDVFAINLREECLVETSVIQELPDGIVLEADERAMAIFEKYDLFGPDSISPEALKNSLIRDLKTKAYPQLMRLMQKYTVYEVHKVIRDVAQTYAGTPKSTDSDYLIGEIFDRLDSDSNITMREGDISQLEKDIADAPVEPIANMESDGQLINRLTKKPTPPWIEPEPKPAIEVPPEEDWEYPIAEVTNSKLKDMVGKEYYVKSAGKRGRVLRISPEHIGGVIVEFPSGDMDIVHFTDLEQDEPNIMRQFIDRMKSPVADRPLKVRENTVMEREIDVDGFRFDVDGVIEELRAWFDHLDSGEYLGDTTVEDIEHALTTGSPDARELWQRMQDLPQQQFRRVVMQIVNHAYKVETDEYNRAEQDDEGGIAVDNLREGKFINPEDMYVYGNRFGYAVWGPGSGLMLTDPQGNTREYWGNIRYSEIQQLIQQREMEAVSIESLPGRIQKKLIYQLNDIIDPSLDLMGQRRLVGKGGAPNPSRDQLAVRQGLPTSRLKNQIRMEPDFLKGPQGALPEGAAKEGLKEVEDDFDYEGTWKKTNLFNKLKHHLDLDNTYDRAAADFYDKRREERLKKYADMDKQREINALKKNAGIAKSGLAPTAPPNPLGSDEGDFDELDGSPYEMGYRAATLYEKGNNANPFDYDDPRYDKWLDGWNEGAEKVGLKEASCMQEDRISMAGGLSRDLMHWYRPQMMQALEQHGIETVMDTIADVAEQHADAEEMGTSDRHSICRQALEQLGISAAAMRNEPGGLEIDEAEYRGRKVSLGKPMQGDVKKFKVYVKDPATGNIKKVNFGDPNMRIKKSNPARRRSFRARHNCANPGPRTKARYWSCRKW